MADRTGDPLIDEIISAFYDELVYLEMTDDEFLRIFGEPPNASEDPEAAVWREAPNQVVVEVPARDLQDAKISLSMCGNVSDQFFYYLQYYGQNMVVSEEEKDEGPTGFGYYDYESWERDYDSSHTAVKVIADSGEYIIDWTASQFGNYDFPMVQKIDPSGEYSRKWTHVISNSEDLFWNSPWWRLSGQSSLDESEFITQPQIGNTAMLITDEYENVPDGSLGYISGKFRSDGLTFYVFSPSDDPDEQVYVEDYQLEVMPNSEDPLEDMYVSSSKVAAGPYLDESSLLRFEGEDLGNNHRFIVSPEGEMYSWPKNVENGEFGKALLALMNDGISLNDLEEFDYYDWLNAGGEENKNLYTNDGWVMGNTSGGGFVLINARSGVVPEQIETLKQAVDINNFRSIVFHVGSDRNFFQRKQDFFRYLNS